MLPIDNDLCQESATDIHNDGTVELIQRWRPGGAQGNTEQVFLDGDSYLFAIRLADDRWEFHAVTARCDEETGCTFRDGSDNPWVAWCWDDVEWWLPVVDLDLPFVL